MSKPKKPKRWLILVDMPDDLKKKLTDEAKRRDWSLRKTIRHAVEAYVQKDGAA